MKLLGKDWKYISEGNLHIVLQILETDYVIRLVKENGKIVDFNSVQSSVHFVNLIMMPLLNTKLHSKVEVISISRGELTELTRILHDIRPENRRIKSVISLHAIKAPNLTIVSANCTTNYCLEIKPKEGFIAHSLKPYSKCYYCMKQYLKVKNKQIKTPSSYCPLDLFSGDKSRMKYALISLFEDPQNNLKLFKDSKLIYSEKFSKLDLDGIINDFNLFKDTNTFFDYTIEMLLAGSHKNIACVHETYKSTKNSHECIESSNLYKNSILYNILILQKLSDSNNFNITDMEANYDNGSTILEEFNKRNLDLNIERDRDKFFEVTDPKHLANISAVAKDCSIMLAFSPDHDVNHPYIEINSQKISYRVSVTDLEPKSVNSLLKRKTTEKEIISAYKSHFEIQVHTETKAKQLEAWQHLITDYLKATKQSTIDIREAQNSPLFNNTVINRKLSQESVLTILEDMVKCGRAAPIDKSKNVWEVYWHSLDEWGNMIYSWASENGMTNSVCTLFELREGEDTVDQEFHGLDMNIIIKALKSLELKGKCELMEFDDSQGVKFF